MGEESHKCDLMGMHVCRSYDDKSELCKLVSKSEHITKKVSQAPNVFFH